MKISKKQLQRRVDLKRTLGELDRMMRALAPKKADWDEMIEEIDHCRCDHCNTVIGRHNLRASLLGARNALSDLIEEIEAPLAA